MISNYEFIKTQSFEVAWAVFRCAELFSQSDLRKKVEAAAVDLIADYDAINESADSEFPRIERLIALTRLAESVGQITSINANVLYRELDNLAKATRLEIAERRDKKNIAGSLETIFTNSAYAKNLAISTSSVIPSLPSDLHSEFGKIDSSTASSTTPLGMTQKNSASTNNSASQFGSIESLLSAATQQSQPIGAPVIPAEEGIQNSPNLATSSIPDILSAYIKAPSASSGQAPSESSRQVTSVQPATELQVRQTTEHMSAPIVRQSPVINRPAMVTTPSTGSWQHVILQKVKDLKQTTTKELTASFPEISERTIRFYLQKLVDSGLIDRIGSTGPGAAYRAK